LERILNTIEGGILRGRFSREWVCGKHWIVDFFFPSVRLAIEVDGPYHRTPDQLLRDIVREVEIERFGVTIMRVTNEEVFGNRDELIAKLKEGWSAAKAAFKLQSRQELRKKKPVPVQIRKVIKSTKPRATPYGGGWTSLQQGVTKVGDNISRQFVDEGFSGSRDANKEMRKQQSGDIMKRGRGE